MYYLVSVYEIQLLWKKKQKLHVIIYILLQIVSYTLLCVVELYNYYIDICNKEGEEK